METKKYEHRRVERKIPLFYMIGLNVALLLTILAFEIKTDKVDVINPMMDETGSIFNEEDYVPPIAFKMPIPTRPQFKETTNEVTSEEPPIIEPPVVQPETGLPGGDVNLPELPPIKTETPEESPFDIVEEMPSYPGGWEKFYGFISKNLKFTSQAKRMGIDGKVFVKFIIEKDGSISNLHVIKHPGAGLDDEAIRVMNLIPEKFNPGKQRGKAVRVTKVLPIHFKLGS
jgi:protein TonB